MAMAHQPLAALFGVLVGVAAEEGCDLGLDGLRQQGSRALAQNFGERVGEGSWLDHPGWISLTTLSWVTACHSFGGEVEARTPPRYAASTPHAVTNFRAYLQPTAWTPLRNPVFCLAFMPSGIRRMLRP